MPIIGFLADSTSDSAQSKADELRASDAGISLGMAVLDSITGQYNGFSDDEFEQVFGSKRDHLWSGRWSMLIPIAAGGAGVVFESVFSERFAASWKAGVVVTGGADSKKPGNAESSGTTSSGSNRGN